MKNYELTYLVSPELLEEEIKKFPAKIKNFVQEETGTLEQATDLLRKKLGYPIKKKGGAFLGVLNFHLSPDKLENLEKKLKSENQILRYTILIRKTIKEHKRRTRRLEQTFSPDKKLTKLNESAAIHPKTAKVELKEIDKKIEEILGE